MTTATPVQQAVCTVGQYLGQRLTALGLKHWFGVPGDFNLLLMDQFLTTPEFEMVCCCNELNAGYAADGYARAQGLSMVTVTYTVGALSMVNAAAGAYSDFLPVLVVSGGPNTNDAPEGHVIHHSLGKPDFFQQRRIFAEVTAGTFVVDRLATAASVIDAALEMLVRERRPVYLEIACNLAAATIPVPGPRAFQHTPHVDTESLKAAVRAARELIEKAVKPVILVGGQVRRGQAVEAVLKLAEATGCPIARLPDAKGRLPEDHPQVMGLYWGSVSAPGVAPVVEASDLRIVVGDAQTDYMTVGWTAQQPEKKTIFVELDRVRLPHAEFTGVAMAAFLSALAADAPSKPASLEAFKRFPTSGEQLKPDGDEAALTTAGMVADIQAILTPETAVLAETGDSWFNGQKLHLPAGAEYEWQMLYGSIGWSVPATLGYAIGSQRRTVTMVGDGSFQLTAQEVSTMIRNKIDPILILINNGGYTIEVEIHDGPYNVIKNWNYAGLIDVFNADDGHGLGLKARTGGEFRDALQKALAHRDGPTLIEVAIGRDDCSQQLLEWGAKVAQANGRPPK